MSETKEVVCLQCPLACKIMVEMNNSGKKEIVSISNHRCPRGEAYARQEIISPVRVLTTTVRVLSRDKDHPLLPVQTAGPIPKELLEKAMKELAGVVLKPPVRYGDVVVPDILGTGVAVKATFEVLE